MQVGKLARRKVLIRQPFQIDAVEFRVDPSRRNRVDPDAFGTEVDRHRDRQPVHPGLGSHVGGVVRIAADRFNRADIDNGRFVLRRHMGHDMLGHQKGAAQVDGHDMVPFRGGLLRQRRAGHDAGIVDQNGRRAVGVGHFRDKPHHRCLVGNIQLQGWQAFGVLRLEVADHDARARLRHGLRDRPTDALSRPGHDRNLVFQYLSHPAV